MFLIIGTHLYLLAQIWKWSLLSQSGKWSQFIGPVGNDLLLFAHSGRCSLFIGPNREMNCIYWPKLGKELSVQNGKWALFYWLVQRGNLLLSAQKGKWTPFIGPNELYLPAQIGKWLLAPIGKWSLLAQIGKLLLSQIEKWSLFISPNWEMISMFWP